MKLEFKSSYLSISQFSPVALKEFTILTGLNGSGKTHLLRAIKEGSIIIEKVNKDEILYYNYNSFVVSQDESLDFKSQEWIERTLRDIKLIESQIKSFNGSKIEGYIREEADRLLNNSSVYHKDAASQVFQSIRNLSSPKDTNDYLEPIAYVAATGDWRDRNDPERSVQVLFYNYYQAGGNHRNFTLSNLQHWAREIQQGVTVIEGLQDKEKEFEKRDPNLYQELRSKIGNSKDIFSLTPEDFEPLSLLIQELAEAEKQYHIDKIWDIIHTDDNSADSFVAAKENRPSILFNEILSDPNHSLNGYTLNADNAPLEKTKDGVKVGTSFYLKNSKTHVAFENLSSGEKTLMALALLVYRARKDKITPRILLLDEIDASLHPSMIKNLLETIQRLFVDKHKMKVILATHSPTTVALSPEESIFVIKNDNGQTQILPQSKEKAINALSDGFITLSKGLELLDQVAQQELNIFTEGKNTEYIEKALELLAPELLPSVQIIKGIEDKAGKDSLPVLSKYFCRLNHTNKVLFVYDCDVWKNPKKQEFEEENNTFLYIFLQNESNNKFRNGIENMFPESLFLDEYYDLERKVQDTGVISNNEIPDKIKIRKHILENGSKEDFKNFDELIERIKSILS